MHFMRIIEGCIFGAHFNAPLKCSEQYIHAVELDVRIVRLVVLKIALRNCPIFMGEKLKLSWANIFYPGPIK